MFLINLKEEKEAIWLIIIWSFNHSGHLLCAEHVYTLYKVYYLIADQVPILVMLGFWIRR